jgi:hypothetical protein
MAMKKKMEEARGQLFRKQQIKQIIEEQQRKL